MTEALTQARKRKEQMLLQAREYVLQALSETPMTQFAHTDLMGALSRLYVEWSNAFEQEQRERLTEQLQQAGIEVRMQHFSGDSSFPTEHTISIDNVHALGPTFGLALADFIAKLSKQYSGLRQEFIFKIEETQH